MSAESQQRTRAERKALYETVVRVADYQSDGPMPAGASMGAIKQCCIFYGRDDNPDPRHIRLAVQAAVDNGDLVRWTDNGGTVTRYTPTTERKLRKLHVYAAERGARELAGHAYRRLQEVEG